MMTVLSTDLKKEKGNNGEKFHKKQVQPPGKGETDRRASGSDRPCGGGALVGRRTNTEKTTPP